MRPGGVRSEVSKKRYRYTGKERDEETGLYYHGERYYAPWLGRWTSCDPAGLTDGPCLYEYAGVNPIKRLDRNGKQYEDIGNDPGLQAAAQAVHDARPELATATAPSVPAGPSVTYPVARGQAGTGQRAFRQSVGLSGRTVQAGHTHRVKESVATQLPRAVRDDPSTMMALHSRRDPRFQVEVTDQQGQTVVRTRHTAQEGMLFEEEVHAAQTTGGTLTREGQVAASQAVRSRAENTPLDQRNANQILSSTRTTEAERIENNPAVAAYRNQKTAGSPPTAQVPSGGGEVLASAESSACRWPGIPHWRRPGRSSLA